MTPSNEVRSRLARRIVTTWFMPFCCPADRTGTGSGHQPSEPRWRARGRTRSRASTFFPTTQLGRIEWRPRQLRERAGLPPSAGAGRAGTRPPPSAWRRDPRQAHPRGSERGEWAARPEVRAHGRVERDQHELRRILDGRWSLVQQAIEDRFAVTWSLAELEEGVSGVASMKFPAA